ADSFGTARELYRAEGILAGSSTGTLLAAALRYCREQTTPKRVVTFVCDTGTRYLSKVYNDHWMFDQGLLTRPRLGDLRDLISRPVTSGGVVSVGPDDTLQTAFSRMRQADVSQLPVLEGGRLVGLLDESDLLARLHADTAAFGALVQSAMNTDVITLAPNASLTELNEQLRRGLVAVIADDTGFHGLVTRFDLINHLRKEVTR
ncbi:MAG TPA: CBS domain-containing protein, partial [Roseateles sp.]